MANDGGKGSVDARLDEKLREQLSFLDRSAKAFDEGHEEEGIRLATVMRVLFHDTFNQKTRKPISISQCRFESDWRHGIRAGRGRFGESPASEEAIHLGEGRVQGPTVTECRAGTTAASWAACPEVTR